MSPYAYACILIFGRRKNFLNGYMAFRIETIFQGYSLSFA
jgi:hypothetical protein